MHSKWKYSWERMSVIAKTQYVPRTILNPLNILFNLHITFIREVLMLTPFYRWEHWEPGRFLSSVRTRIWAQLVWIQRLSLLLTTVLPVLEHLPPQGPGCLGADSSQRQMPSFKGCSLSEVFKSEMIGLAFAVKYFSMGTDETSC